MEQEQGPDSAGEKNGASDSSSGNTNTLVTILGVALVIAVIGFLAMVAIVVFGDGSDSDTGSGGGATPPPGITIVPTKAVATPEPGQPTAVVVAPAGVNVRVGPGAQYPAIGIAPFGATGEIVGVSHDGTWWVVKVPGAPNDQGWVADEYVQTENADGVPVLQPPPLPAPGATITPLPTAVPETTVAPQPTSGPEISFSASRTTINAGETATLSWNVENVKAVYMFPVGASPFDYPVTGQGSRDVQPGITTSYELRVVNSDDSSSSQRIEITVIGGLTDARWLLQSYSMPETGSRTPLAGTQITARFEVGGSLNGSSGCNSYEGGFTAYDQTLQIGRLAVTQAFCSAPAGVMDQESIVLGLMEQASRFLISAGQLEVFDAGGNRILVFING